MDYASRSFCERYGDLLTGSYDCVDRVVLNAFFPLGHNPGGFRCWWWRLHGNDDDLDNTHLMRFAGRFARRVKAWAAANGVPVIYCKAGERKHLIAEEHLAAHPPSGPGVFLVLAAKAPASVREVRRSQSSGVIGNIAKKTTYVNHYSFHIMDPAWGHVTIKMSGHPPFPAQVILNGHEYVAAQARATGTGFTKEGNCFTEIADPQRLAQAADTLSQPAAIGRLGQVCDRWIYSACLCFGLDLAEQARSGFRYAYSIYQAEYSRNLLFRSGAQMEDLFDRICDRTRSRLNIPSLRTLFGLKNRPHSNRAAGPPAQEIVIENSRYGLTWFRIRFGLLQLKAYIKGEHVLRFEATVHNTKELRCRRSLENFPEIIIRLAGMAERFATTLDCADVSFLPDGHARRSSPAVPDRRHPHRRHRPEQAPHPHRLGRGAGPGRRTTRLHRRRIHHQGPAAQQARGLHDPPRRLRPAQAPRQGPRHQARTHPPIPHPTSGGPHHRRPARPPRRGHRPDPCWHPQPPPRPQTRPLDPDRPRLRNPPHRHAEPLRRLRDHAHRGCRRIDNTLSIGEMQAPRPSTRGLFAVSGLAKRQKGLEPQRVTCI
jgi:hypothetical protein